MSDKARELLERALEIINASWYGEFELKEEIRAYLAEPEVKQDDEPVAWIREVDIDNPVSALVRTQHECGDCNIPLYLHPEPKVPFVRLTEEELKECWGFPYSLSTDELRRFARAIEDALEEKNK